MKSMFVLALLVTMGGVALVFLTGSHLAAPHAPAASPAVAGEPVVHVDNAFEFTVHAPLATVMPLFGAFEERRWGGDGWNPEFLHPTPPRDTAGEVFTVEHGPQRSVWVNTAMDLESGHVQYVYFVPGAMTVLIDIRARATDAASTHVDVTYQRTALNPELNSHVTELGRKDRDNGAHWAAEISKCLGVR